MRHYSLLLLPLLFPLCSPFGLGSSSAKALYSESDPGIVLLNATNVGPTVHHSGTGWLVEFYSSWCGHCIHFAPIFKELAKDVKGWHRVIRVGAIDCADESNMATCRQYEVMGYPTLKFFPPSAADNDIGEARQSHSKEVSAMKADMHDFVSKAMMNESLKEVTNGWPNLEGFKSPDLTTLWSSASSSLSKSPFALLILHKESDVFPALDLLLDASELSTPRTPLILRRVNVDTAPEALLSKIGAGKSFPQLISYSKVEKQAKTLYESNPSEDTATQRTNLLKAAKEFIWSESSSFSSGAKKAIEEEKEGAKLEEKEKAKEKLHPTHNEGEIKRRRYTTYMWDLEQAVSYLLSHEASGHATITGEALVALQDLTDVLARVFPARPRVKKLLADLRLFVLDHDDALKGEDLSAHIEALKGDTGAFRELGGTHTEWIGCKGSADNYGGYPCGLWTLFHTLTVHEKKIGGAESGSVVLKAIADYIHHFFGCRECARHFSQEVGLSPISDVPAGADAVMWLWRTHNKVNVRLSGDLTDDPVFPKEPFPNRQHCSDCYTGRIAGYDLSSEYKLPSVERFLRLLYTDIDLSGMDTALDDEFADDEDDDEPPRPVHHDLAIVQENKHAYQREENVTSFMSQSDARLSVFVYVLSALVIMVGYYKFVARRRGSVLARLCPKGSRAGSPSYNPLHGKV